MNLVLGKWMKRDEIITAKACHSSYMSLMGSNKGRTTLFSPKAFQVGMGGDSVMIVTLVGV